MRKVLNIEKNKKGFTIIELLVVMAIICILCGIAIPLYASSRMKAGDTAAKVELRNVMEFLDIYYLNYDTYPETVDDLLAAGCRLSVVITRSPIVISKNLLVNSVVVTLSVTLILNT